MTCSRGTKRQPSGSGTNRGSIGGTFTRAKRWTPLSGSRTTHRQVQRQVRDVGERVRRVDGERREHRVHELLERALQLGAVGRVEVVPVEESDARLLELGHDVLRERGRLALDEASGPARG